MKARPSLIVVLSLRHEQLLMLFQGAKKRKHHVEDDYTYEPGLPVKDYNPSTPRRLRIEDSEVEDYVSYAPHTRSWTRLRKESDVKSDNEHAPRISHRSQSGGADDEDDDHAPQARSKRSRTEESVRQGKGKVEETRYTRNTTPLAAQHLYDEIRNDISRLDQRLVKFRTDLHVDTDQEFTLFHPTEDILDDLGTNIVETDQDQPCNELLDSEVDRDNQDTAIVEENPLTLGSNEDDLVAPVEDELIDSSKKESSKTDQHTPESELNLDSLRLNLHVLLLGELCDTAGTHSTSKDTDEMWKMSQEINFHLKLLWAADKEANLLAMGGERYKMVNRVLDEWLVRRDITRRLGSVAGVHTSQGPLPRLTGKQWAEKLGGIREFRETDLLLATYRQLLGTSSSGTTKDDFADCLADAFASVIKYSLGIEDFKTFYMDDILKFNEKLFAWTLDFAPKQ